MKPEVKKLKNIRGRIVGYSASIGDVISSGTTPKEASDKCERLVLDALERLAWGTLVDSWQGHTIVVSPTTEGWSYWIDTARYDYSISGAWNTREDARCSALHHLAQHLWNVTEDDAAFLAELPESVSGELARWIRFQRSYMALKAQGKSDSEAHRLAVTA